MVTAIKNYIKLSHTTVSMIDKDKILQIVQVKGYVLPSDLTRQFHADTFIIGAVLSDLVREKKLHVSRVKVGRSPVYYSLNRRDMLQELYSYLNDKDKQVYNLLKQQTVLKDTDQSLLVRVSLKQMKDFAKPIEVTHGETTTLFYKWYLATDQEVHAVLSVLLSPKPDIYIEAPKQEQGIQPIVEQVVEVPPQEKLAPSLIPTETQHILDDENLMSRLLQHDDSFAQEIAQYFQIHQINLVHFKHIKKGEFDCIVKVPSAVGDISYFCKAKKKKKCNEGDLATVFVAAQMKKLPTLFLTNGEFPKKLLQKLPLEYPNTKILVLEE